MHDDTPALLQWKKSTFTFKLKATQPSSNTKDVLRGDIELKKKSFFFMFRGEFEYDGYDIRNARVSRVLQDSSALKDEKFATKWKAKKAVPLNAERAQIDFLMDGTWVPTTGSKNFSFTGKLTFRSDGHFSFDLDKNDNVKVEFKAGGTYWSLDTVNVGTPRKTREWHAVMFDPQGSDTISEKEMKRLKNWIVELKKDDVRYRRLVAGAITVNVEGHASATGKGQFNQDLSGKRADKVIKLLKEYLGSSLKVVRFAFGEDDPTIPRIHEKDDPAERRADIWFEILG
jgi:outer membrane protein OmpA-like peptidoglycan-associated protein